MRSQRSAGVIPPFARIVIASAVLWCALLLLPAPASAYPEPPTVDPGGAGCQPCHTFEFIDGVFRMFLYPPWAGDCARCHGASTDSGYDKSSHSGPHGGYTATTRKCQACHTVHDAPADSPMLLPAPTIVETCSTCHDGTAGFGVYGAIKAQTGLDPATDRSLGSHRIGATLVPGADAATGGGAAREFRGPDGGLICTDCHDQHGYDVVGVFQGERARFRGYADGGFIAPQSTRILRREPTGALASVEEYGSDWCLACHAGRASGGTVHNHPSESSSTTAEPYVYSRLPILASAGPTGSTKLGQLGGVPYPVNLHETTVDNAEGNRGYLMPYPRTAQQDGRYPICQQCHEDARIVGNLDEDGRATVVPFKVHAADGVKWDTATSSWVVNLDDNPRFQNFPHETTNRYMLVETDDDLCINCHSAQQLP